MSDAVSSSPLSPTRRRLWKTKGSGPRVASSPSSVMRLPKMHFRGTWGERWINVRERTGCSGSSSGMTWEGGRWRVVTEDAKVERRGSEGSEDRESLELKRDILAPGAQEAADVWASPTERTLEARGRSGEDGLRMLGPGRGSWRFSGARERAEALLLRVVAAVVGYTGREMVLPASSLASPPALRFLSPSSNSERAEEEGARPRPLVPTTSDPSSSTQELFGDGCLFH